MTGPRSTGLDPRLAAILCYSVWWITGLVFLLVERDDRTTRFHAAQSLVLFGTVSLLLAGLAAVSVLALVVSSGAYQLLRIVSDLTWLAAVALWLVLMLRAWRGETWRVPGVAAIADRMAGPA